MQSTSLMPNKNDPHSYIWNTWLKEKNSNIDLEQFESNRIFSEKRFVRVLLSVKTYSVF